LPQKLSDAFDVTTHKLTAQQQRKPIDLWWSNDLALTDEEMLIANIYLDVSAKPSFLNLGPQMKSCDKNEGAWHKHFETSRHQCNILPRE